jgi:hypothetical protein
MHSRERSRAAALISDNKASHERASLKVLAGRKSSRPRPTRASSRARGVRKSVYFGARALRREGSGGTDSDHKRVMPCPGRVQLGRRARLASPFRSPYRGNIRPRPLDTSDDLRQRSAAHAGRASPGHGSTERSGSGKGDRRQQLKARDPNACATSHLFRQLAAGAPNGAGNGAGDTA